MRDGLRAYGFAAALLGWSWVTPNIPARWNPLPQALFGATMAALADVETGLRPPALRRGLRWGSAAASTVALGVAVGAAMPAVRSGMADREVPEAPGRWLLLRIPIGTVWSEEMAYRGALDGLAVRAFGARSGRVFAAAVFGLSHLPDARAARDSVAGTVLVTAAAGWVFSWLHARSGSLAAPMLAHLGVNEAGAVAALALRRPGRRPATVIARGGASRAAIL